ncbi:MAG: PDZ domain-containing protein, partial [Clostridiales bacterium]|nr:PDZ domain-containing protein [Clostridiales bacterium]
IGNPLGELGGTVTNGIVSALSRRVTIEGYVMDLLQTNAAVNPGNSGGGLFNEEGKLIGIVNAKATGENVEGLGFAIPINEVRSVINNLIDLGYVPGRVSMGVSLIGIHDQASANSYRVSTYGVYIYSVIKDSPADKAGLTERDRIYSVNGVLINSVADVIAQLDQCKVGDTITVVYYRSSTNRTAQVTLEQYKGVQR